MTLGWSYFIKVMLNWFLPELLPFSNFLNSKSCLCNSSCSFQWILMKPSRYCSGPGCSKLTMSLVNVSLKFQMLISNIRQYFLLKNVRSFCSAKASLIFSTKNISVFGYKVIKHLTNWPLNELVKLTMLWTTGPWWPEEAYTIQRSGLTGFYQSYGPLSVLAILWIQILVIATPPTLLKGFWWNFPVIVSMTKRWSYFKEVMLD